MKRKLLILFCFISSITFAQTITTFNSEDLSSYAIINGTVDQSPTGASTTWNFNTLASTGTSTDTYTAPIGSESTTFPGTTIVYTNTVVTSGDEAKIFLNETAGELSLTGATTPDLELNYITDNALIGTFPLSFGYNNTDPVAGTFDNGTVSGTFAGNIVKTVDAHGTLNMNDVGAGAYSSIVTRLKISQAITLSIPPFIPNAGTVTQTSYYYYDNSNGNLVFRSNTIHIVVPIANIDETTTVNESLLTNLLDVHDVVVKEFSIAPNPVNDVLNIRLKTTIAIKSVIILDVNGRQVISNTNNTSIDVSHLQAGMYFVAIQTDKAIFNQKFIKN